MAFLLLCSGDIESNPGPNTRSESLFDIESLPEDPSEQMNLIFKLIKDVHTRSLLTSKFQTEITADVKAIKSGQKSLESKVSGIMKRLDALEEKSQNIDNVSLKVSSMTKTIEEVSARNNLFESRLNELEDRSRRDNLIFHGLPDNIETWQETESNTTRVISSITDTFPADAIQRAYRLGSFMPNKSRPVIVKFASFKTKEKLLSLRSQFKHKNISISEDFSVATRTARRKLIAFGKSQASSEPFKLRYDKLILNGKSYVYNAHSDEIQELKQRSNNVVRASPVPSRPPI